MTEPIRIAIFSMRQRDQEILPPSLLSAFPDQVQVCVARDGAELTRVMQQGQMHMVVAHLRSVGGLRRGSTGNDPTPLVQYLKRHNCDIPPLVLLCDTAGPGTVDANSIEAIIGAVRQTVSSPLMHPDHEVVIIDMVGRPVYSTGCPEPATRAALAAALWLSARKVDHVLRMGLLERVALEHGTLEPRGLVAVWKGVPVQDEQPVRRMVTPAGGVTPLSVMRLLDEVDVIPGVLAHGILQDGDRVAYRRRYDMSLSRDAARSVWKSLEEALLHSGVRRAAGGVRLLWTFSDRQILATMVGASVVAVVMDRAVDVDVDRIEQALATFEANPSIGCRRGRPPLSLRRNRLVGQPA